jgi:hypothetical protein
VWCGKWNTETDRCNLKKDTAAVPKPLSLHGVSQCVCLRPSETEPDRKSQLARRTSADGRATVTETQGSGHELGPGGKQPCYQAASRTFPAL